MTESTTTADKFEVSKRVERALSETLYAEKGQYSEHTYRVHSGSGATYAVDLDAPDGDRYCSCPDTGLCKHLLHVLLVETPDTLIACEHGDTRCPGVAAISFEDGEPVFDGPFPCAECFTKASFTHTDEPATTDTDQHTMADGGHTLTTLDAGLTVSDETGEKWTIDTPVEQVPTPRGNQPRTRLVNASGEIQRLDPRTFVEAVEDEHGEFTLATDGSNGGDH